VISERGEESMHFNQDVWLVFVVVVLCVCMCECVCVWVVCIGAN